MIIYTVFYIQDFEDLGVLILPLCCNLLGLESLIGPEDLKLRVGNEPLPLISSLSDTLEGLQRVVQSSFQSECGTGNEQES